MATYNATFRTSNFRVTDEKKYRELCARILGDVEFWENKSKDGSAVYHGFGGFCASPIYASLPSERAEVREFFEKEGAVLYTEEGTPVRSLEEADNAVMEHDVVELYQKKDGDKDGDCLYDIDDKDDCDALEDSEFITEIQKILHPDDAFVLMETGHESLRYCAAYVTIATVNEVKFFNLDSVARSYLRAMLGEEKGNNVPLAY